MGHWYMVTYNSSRLRSGTDLHACSNKCTCIFGWKLLELPNVHYSIFLYYLMFEKFLTWTMWSQNFCISCFEWTHKKTSSADVSHYNKELKKKKKTLFGMSNVRVWGPTYILNDPHTFLVGHEHFRDTHTSCNAKILLKYPTYLVEVTHTFWWPKYVLGGPRMFLDVTRGRDDRSWKPRTPLRWRGQAVRDRDCWHWFKRQIGGAPVNYLNTMGAYSFIEQYSNTLIIQTFSLENII